MTACCYRRHSYLFCRFWVKNTPRLSSAALSRGFLAPVPRCYLCRLSGVRLHARIAQLSRVVSSRQPRDRPHARQYPQTATLGREAPGTERYLCSQKAILNKRLGCAAFAPSEERHLCSYAAPFHNRLASVLPPPRLRSLRSERGATSLLIYNLILQASRLLSVHFGIERHP